MHVCSVCGSKVSKFDLTVLISIAIIVQYHSPSFTHTNTHTHAHRYPPLPYMDQEPCPASIKADTIVSETSEWLATTLPHVHAHYGLAGIDAATHTLCVFSPQQQSQSPSTIAHLPTLLPSTAIDAKTRLRLSWSNTTHAAPTLLLTCGLHAVALQLNKDEGRGHTALVENCMPYVSTVYTLPSEALHEQWCPTRSHIVAVALRSSVVIVDVTRYFQGKRGGDS